MDDGLSEVLFVVVVEEVGSLDDFFSVVLVVVFVVGAVDFWVVVVGFVVGSTDDFCSPVIVVDDSGSPVVRVLADSVVTLVADGGLVSSTSLVADISGVTLGLPQETTRIVARMSEIARSFFMLIP